MNGVDSKRILHVTFNMEIGGTEQVIKQIVLASDDRFEHQVLCIDGRVGSMGEQLKEAGVPVTSRKRKPGLDLSLVREMRSLVRALQIDVLHCHQYTPFSYGALAAFGSALRLVFTEHGRFYPDRHNLKRRLVNPLLASRAQHITAISRATADALHEFEYIPRKRVRVIYNGIEDADQPKWSREDLLGEIGLSSRYRYLGTVARLQPIKNQMMMLQAFKVAVEARPDVNLVVIGDGPSRTELEEFVEDSSLSDRVHFLGFLEDPRKYINVFDIFLLSSLSEGTSMTLLEAMCCGKPCIATDVGGNAEVIVDGETGLITPSRDVTEFAAAIGDLINSDEKRTEMGKRGRERFLSQFTVDRMTNEYEKLYQGAQY